MNLAKIYVGGFISVSELSLVRTHTYIRCNRRSLENTIQSPQDGDLGIFLPPVARNKDTQTTGCVNGGAGKDTSLFVSNRILIPGYCDLEMIAKFILKAF